MSISRRDTTGTKALITHTHTPLLPLRNRKPVSAALSCHLHHHLCIKDHLNLHTMHREQLKTSTFDAIPQTVTSPPLEYFHNTLSCRSNHRSHKNISGSFTQCKQSSSRGVECTRSHTRKRSDAHPTSATSSFRQQHFQNTLSCHLNHRFHGKDCRRSTEHRQSSRGKCTT